jgi:antitoxin ParD1/3/4
LTPELHALVQESVSAGEYASASEVVREALRHWKHQREQRRAAIIGLRRLWDEGLASGPAVPRDMEAIKREGRRRLDLESRPKK